MDQHLEIENNEMCAKKREVGPLISTLFAFSFCNWLWECDVKKEGHDILRLSEKKHICVFSHWKYVLNKLAL